MPDRLRFLGLQHRGVLRAFALAVVAGGLFGLAPGASGSAHAQGASLKIGIIGTGRIGGALARDRVRARAFDFVPAASLEEPRATA